MNKEIIKIMLKYSSHITKGGNKKEKKNNIQFKIHVLLICPVSVSSIYVTLRKHKNNNHFLWLLI